MNSNEVVFRVSTKTDAKHLAGAISAKLLDVSRHKINDPNYTENIIITAMGDHCYATAVKAIAIVNSTYLLNKNPLQLNITFFNWIDEVDKSPKRSIHFTLNLNGI